MSMDDYNKVSGQLKQMAIILNKRRNQQGKEETKDEVPSMDSEVFFNFEKRDIKKKMSQSKVHFEAQTPSHALILPDLQIQSR